MMNTEFFDVEKALSSVLSDGKDSPCIFDRLLQRFESHASRPASTIYEIKRRDNKKSKGDAWERFCQFYLVHVLNYKSAWLWHEIPDEIRRTHKLGSKVDNGIDIVALKSGDDDLTAIQCKYRKNITQTVTWTQLSTFFGLCSITGPWREQIVMTNCKGVSRKTGIPKRPNEKTIAYGTFKNLTRENCLRKHSDDSYQTVSENNNQVPATLEEIRALRVSHFSHV